MPTTVTVYSKDNCAQCRMTMRQLDKADVDYVVADATDDTNYTYITAELGHSQAPVVTITGDGASNGQLEHWAGFRPERITDAVARFHTSSGTPEQQTTTDSADLTAGTRQWFIATVAQSRDLSHADFRDLSSDAEHTVAASNDIDARVFTGADFTNAQLGGVTFNRCDVSSANFTDADLTLTQFWGTDVAGVDFTNANLTGADLSTALNIESIDSLDNTRLDRANLTGLNFSQQAIGTASYSRALLGLSRFDDVILHGADMNRADLSGASFSNVEARDINLSETTAHGFTATHCDLTDATLHATAMTGARFDHTTLNNVDFTDADLTGGILGDCSVEAANFTRADMQGMIIADDVSMVDATFTQARLAGATATGVDFTDCVLSHADLRGADLRGATLSYASLDHTDLRGADLRGADLTSASFTGATIDGAKFDDAILERTTGLTPSSSGNAPHTVLRGLHATSLPQSLASVREAAGSPIPRRTDAQTTAPSSPSSPAADSGPTV